MMSVNVGVICLPIIALSYFILRTNRTSLLTAIILSIPFSPKLTLIQLSTITVEYHIHDVIILFWFIENFLIRKVRVRFDYIFSIFILSWIFGIMSSLIAVGNQQVNLFRAGAFLIKELEFLLIALFASNDCAALEDYERINKSIGLCCFIMGSLAIYQYITGNYWGIAGNRASLPFDNGPFPLGGVSLAYLNVVLSNMFFGRRRLYSAAATIFAAIAIVLSGSRASIIGVAIVRFPTGDNRHLTKTFKRLLIRCCHNIWVT